MRKTETWLFFYMCNLSEYATPTHQGSWQNRGLTVFFLCNHLLCVEHRIWLYDFICKTAIEGTKPDAIMNWCFLSFPPKVIVVFTFLLLYPDWIIKKKMIRKIHYCDNLLVYIRVSIAFTKHYRGYFNLLCDVANYIADYCIKWIFYHHSNHIPILEQVIN